MCSYPVLHISHMCMNLFYIHIKLYIYIFIYICVCMLYKLYPYNYVRLLQSIQDICTFTLVTLGTWNRGDSVISPKYPDVEVTWNSLILLMAEILHHLGCMKPYK